MNSAHNELGRRLLPDDWARMGVHRASQQSHQPACTTGWPRLDAALPGGGFPLGAVTELLVEQMGTGELSLLCAALSQRLLADTNTQLIFANPPRSLSAQALLSLGVESARVPIIRCADTAECVWGIEQLAAAGGFCAFVLWDSAIKPAAIRRLQLAGEKAACPVFLYREMNQALQRSPAALRLAVSTRDNQQYLEILKCRGPAGTRIEGLRMHRDVSSWRWQSPHVEIDALARPYASNDEDDTDNSVIDSNSVIPPVINYL